MPNRWTRPVVALLVAAVCGAAVAETPPMTDHRTPVANREPLASTPFVRLPIGAVKAEGWLKRQLDLQKNGLTGSAEQLYDALTPKSAWLGGDGDNWEKGPYYIKGLTALAYTTDDAELKARAKKWIDWTLGSQRENGQFGPTQNDDHWPRMVSLYYLRDHYEATGDKRVIPFLTNYFRYQLSELPKRPLKDWGRSRAGDNIDVVLWTYNRTGDKQLLDLAKVLYEQAYPWTSIFTDNRFFDFGEDYQPHHIVNVSQALKFPAVAYQFTKSEADKNGFAAGVANMNRQYGRIDGQVSGTEMLSGLKSTDGVELCADIERIISNDAAIAVLGDPALGDQLEKVAYNSLPAHTSPTMRQITYYQLVNQVAATHGGHGFTQDYANGNVPGPHSGFPCCCYNWHAGWPKFVQGMWAATNDGGLVAVAYGPNKLTTTVAGNTPITVTQTTDYPFAETITLKVEPKQAATFPLVLRVPAWCKTPSIKVNGQAVADVKAGTFHTVNRPWKAGDTVAIDFPMTVRTSTWVNNATGIERGPLAYALKIKEGWTKTHEFLRDFDEYEVRPQSPWNYALQTDAAGSNVKVVTKPVGPVPFATDAAPVTLTVPAKKLPGWTYRATPPGSVVLGRSEGGFHQLAKESMPLEAGKPHRVRVEAKGPALRVFIDDMTTPAIERNDATLAQGGVGLRTYEGRVRFDDVRLNGKLVADFKDGKSDAWQVFGGRWRVRDGAYAADAAKDGKSVLKSARNLTDIVFEATITLQPGGDAGLMVRTSELSDKLDGYKGYYVGLSAKEVSEDAAEPPASPVTSGEPLEEVELIPFGSAKLRVSYFPTLKAN